MSWRRIKHKEIFRGFNFCPNSNFLYRVMAMVFIGLESRRPGWGGKTQNNQKTQKFTLLQRTGKTFL